MTHPHRRSGLSPSEHMRVLREAGERLAAAAEQVHDGAKQSNWHRLEDALNAWDDIQKAAA